MKGEEEPFFVLPSPGCSPRAEVTPVLPGISPALHGHSLCHGRGCRAALTPLLGGDADLCQSQQ